MEHGRVLLGLMLTTLIGAQEVATSPRTAPTLQLRARVCDAAGQPLVNAGIVIGLAELITTTEALSRPQAKSAGNGRLELEVPVRPSDYYTATAVLIAAPGKVAFRVPNLNFLTQRSAVQDESVLDLGEIRLPDGFTLSGRVRGQGGKPISGARIRALDSLTTYPWMSPCYGSQATTAENGVFQLRGVFANAMTVTVAADGYHSRTFPAMDLAAPLDVQLEASGFVEGTVQDEAGKPFDGLVVATHEFMGAETPPVRSAQGKFRLGVTTPCRFKVFAFDPTTGRMAESALLHGPTAGVELRFGGSPEKVFVIRAVDAATDQPIAPVRASASWFAEEITGSIERMLVWGLQGSGTDGKVWVEPPPVGFPNKGVVHVCAVGRAPFFAQGVEWKDGEEFVARLEPESQIEGRVVDAATGKPAARMIVTCERVRKRQGSLGNAPPPQASVLTAEDGSFAFRGLCKGAHELAVRWPGGTAMASKHTNLQTAEVRTDLELVLPGGVTVTGKVTGAEITHGWKVQLAKTEQEPVEDPWSAGSSVLEAWNLEGAQPLTDGVFRFEHRAAGTEQLFLVVPLPPRNGAALRIPLTTVRIGKDDVALDVDISKHLPGAVRGKVTLRGAELPSGRLAVMTIRRGDDKGGWIRYEEQIRRRHWTLVAADGTFEIPADAGTYELEAIDVATGVTLARIEDPVTVAAGKPTKRDLRVDVVAAKVLFETADKGRLNTERVEIRVGTDAGDGRVTMFAGGQRGTPGVDLAGAREVLFFVPPGPVRLRVEVGAMLAGRNFQWGSEPHAEETFEAELGKVSEVTMTLPPPADLGGR